MLLSELVLTSGCLGGPLIITNVVMSVTANCCERKGKNLWLRMRLLRLLCGCRSHTCLFKTSSALRSNRIPQVLLSGKSAPVGLIIEALQQTELLHVVALMHTSVLSTSVSHCKHLWQLVCGVPHVCPASVQLVCGVPHVCPASVQLVCGVPHVCPASVQLVCGVPHVYPASVQLVCGVPHVCPASVQLV